MAKITEKSAITTVQENAPVQQAAARTVAGVLDSLLDSEKMRSRFQELLGKRMPSFMGSIVSMINENPQLKKCFMNQPVSVLQSALKAAAYNLPIDPALGFAYVVPFGDKATFVLGYKGMIQLANRTGAYEKLNVVDVREGELKSFDRLTEDVAVEWEPDEEKRERLPVIGYLGYFRLVNGFEKKIYMSVGAINAHEKKHRKGRNASRPAIWNDNYDAMASKTVLRRMISKWGLMSIDYQRADEGTLKIAQDIATGQVDDEEAMTIDANATEGVIEPSEGMDVPEETPPTVEF